MATMICHICLRTDIIAVNIATELTFFFDELCDYSNIKNPKYKYCTICAHLLKKFYNFRQRCLKACKILKSLKGKKVLPTDLHEQIPSSIGLCSSLAPYKLLKQHDTDNEPVLKNEPNVTSNDIKVNNQQNLETADPTLQHHIKVKDELMHNVPDSNIDTLQAANVESLDVVTTSDGNLVSRNNFEEEVKSIQLDKEEFNTDDRKNTDGSKNNAKKSIIDDFIESFEKEIEDDDNSVDADDMEVLDDDDTFLLNNDPLKDDESLNSMDDIESDISDCDVKSVNIDEQNSEFDSETDSLAELFKRAKNKKLKVSKINDLELAEKLFKMNRKNKLLKNRVKLLKNEKKRKNRPVKLKGKPDIKTSLLKLFENDEYNLDGVKISKALFLKIYERYEKNPLPHKRKELSNKKKKDAFLRFLLRMYNPEYETVFDIEYLNTEEKKLQEFSRRKESAEYRETPYQCERCYRGFHIQDLRNYHMKKHDESSGPHECHICYLRFRTVFRLNSHGRYCHSAVYVCRLCHITLYYSSSMQNHFNLHKGKEFPCPICNGIYRTRTALANHKRSHVTSHICTTCARSFVSATGLSTHRRIKHKDAPEPRPADAVRCTECALTLDSQKAYETHLKISHRTNGYTCGNCSKRFPSMAELRQHKVVEGHQHCAMFQQGNMGYLFKRTIGKSKGRPRDKAEKRTCPVCQEEVRFLYQHHKRHHPGVPYQMVDAGSAKNYLCDQCGKQFHIYTHFLDHKNTHIGIRPYTCSECPRTFATSVHLRSHSKYHRPPTHKCKYCGKLFKQATNLSCHMRIHINDRCYKCDICPSSFLHAAALKEHIRGVHLNQRRVRKRKLT